MSHRFSHITGRVHRAYNPPLKRLDPTVKMVYGHRTVLDANGPNHTVETRVYITFSTPVSMLEAKAAAPMVHELRRKNRSGRKWTAVLSYSPNY